MPLDITQEDFLGPAQVLALKQHCRGCALDESTDGRRHPVRDWAILHVALDSGLRVSEICDLRLRDVLLESGRATLIVRDGKGHKKRGVRIGEALRAHLEEFVRWKASVGEPLRPEAPLFVSGRGDAPLTRTAVYRVFKKSASAVGIPERYSIHSCRHTYASLLYRASEFNLRLVQKQLGHSSIQTTQVYADVLDEDTASAVNRLPQ